MDFKPAISLTIIGCTQDDDSTSDDTKRLSNLIDKVNFYSTCGIWDQSNVRFKHPTTYLFRYFNQSHVCLGILTNYIAVQVF